jgi:hypothetical protein
MEKRNFHATSEGGNIVNAIRKGMTASVLAAVIIVFMMPAAAMAADAPVATLTAFSGKVAIRSQGSWGVKAQTGLPLYNGDKIVTRVGSAVLSFPDGAVMEIGPNSNLEVREVQEEQGWFKKTRFVKRKLRLMLGKLIFRTGAGSATRTVLETPTAVCGLRGTGGVISLGEDGQTYIQFSEGGPSFSVGDLLSGVAPAVPAEVADLNPVQMAAFIANTAAEQAAADGSSDAAQLAALAAAKEAMASAAAIIADNPDADVVSEAREELEAAAQKARDIAQTLSETSTNPDVVTEANNAAEEAGNVLDSLPPPPDPTDTPLSDPPPIEDVAEEASPT